MVEILIMKAMKQNNKGVSYNIEGDLIYFEYQASNELPPIRRTFTIKQLEAFNKKVDYIDYCDLLTLKTEEKI